MSEIFLVVLNMSLLSGYVILFVICTRLLLKKAPKIISYILWSVVAFRLISPFSFQSILSLLPRGINTAPITRDILYQQQPEINTGMKSVNQWVNKVLPWTERGDSVNPLQIYAFIGAHIWIFGMLLLLIYGLVSILRLKNQLRGARNIEQNIYEAENLKTPFVFGFLNPKIYLPASLEKEERQYILLHEQIHIRRYDHIIKPFAFLILCIHWFNPLVWAAFLFMGVDMELSCDEQVLKEMNATIKKPYANLVLKLAVGHIINGSPLAFGEGNAKRRIRNILGYKKVPAWISVFAFMAIILLCLGLVSNPPKMASITEDSTSGVTEPVYEEQMKGDEVQGQTDSAVLDSPEKELESVRMIIKEGSLSAAGMTLIFENLSDKEYFYGSDYSLEEKRGETWNPVSIVIEKYGFTLEAYLISPKGSSEWKVDWQWLYGSLDTGEYRIQKRIHEFRSPGDFDEYDLLAEFRIP